MPKQKLFYICANCGYESAKWAGVCLKCGKYNTFEEYTPSDSSPLSPSAYTLFTLTDAAPEIHTPTKLPELDRVLNGGLVNSSAVLLGGEPGVGKSTLLLQLCGGVDARVLYISGEESPCQINSRANRLSVSPDNIFLAAESSLGAIHSAITDIKPDIILVDSIQTTYNENISSSPGSVTQVRECANFFIKHAKKSGCPVILVGHITKDGAIAGPKVLEHMVDTVLYFEGERHANYRIVRSVKNRFGPTNELGIFEMTEHGLVSIGNPSEYMLGGRIKAPGSAVTALIEGSRPILIEVQALCSQTSFGNPRRIANGIDYNRAVMLTAVLEKRAGLNLTTCDAYLNIAGGLKTADPSVDLAVVASLAGSFKNRVIDSKTMLTGEVGLTGEVRAVTNPSKRIAEAARFGFTTCVIPQANQKGLEQSDIRVLGVSNITEMLELLF